MRAALAAIAAPVWRRLRGRTQWSLLYRTNARFMVGVAGVCVDARGHVLLLSHRFWPEGSWGLPSGYVRRSERFEDAIAREVREETGLTIADPRLVRVVSGYRLRAEVYFVARVEEGGGARLDPGEVLRLQFAAPDDLPPGLLPAHRAIIAEALASER